MVDVRQDLLQGIEAQERRAKDRAEQERRRKQSVDAMDGLPNFPGADAVDQALSVAAAVGAARFGGKIAKKFLGKRLMYKQTGQGPGFPGDEHLPTKGLQDWFKDRAKIADRVDDPSGPDVARWVKESKQGANDVRRLRATRAAINIGSQAAPAAAVIAGSRREK